MIVVSLHDYQGCALTRSVLHREYTSVMEPPKGDKEGLFTYCDYLTWPDEERWELINGVAYNMSPAPVRRHQGILAELSVEFGLHFRNRPCSVYMAPFNVVLPDLPADGAVASSESTLDEESDTVVQPDLVVICDPSKLTRRGCPGAPDFVLEILSPSTAFKDMEDKLRLYERHGVLECWSTGSSIPATIRSWSTPLRRTADFFD